MTLFVAVDIGCIECGEASAVLGVFTTREQADSVIEDHDKRHQENWIGQHSFEVFEVPDVDEVCEVQYR